MTVILPSTRRARLGPGAHMGMRTNCSRMFNGGNGATDDVQACQCQRTLRRLPGGLAATTRSRPRRRLGGEPQVKGLAAGGGWYNISIAIKGLGLPPLITDGRLLGGRSRNANGVDTLLLPARLG